jgi:hypothetical protein
LEIKHAQNSIQVNEALKQHATHKHHHIDENQILGYRGGAAKSTT